MILSAFSEVVSLGALVPFLGILAAPDAVLQNQFIAARASEWGIASAEQLVLPLAALFAVAAIFAAFMRILVTWLSTRLTFATSADLSMEIYWRTLHQPYEVHVARSSSEMIAGITGKVGATSLGIILPLLTLISSAVLLVAIMFALIAINPPVALLSAAGFGACYGLITWMARHRVKRNSELIANEQVQVVKALQEGLGGIRDVLLAGTQSLYYDVYRTADRRWRLAQGDNVFIGHGPRFAMEAVGMVLIAGLAYGLSRQPGGIATALPVLGALAFGAQRLLPVMQQGYASWTSITSSRASFADTIALLDQPMPAEMEVPPPAPLRLRNSIRLENVSFGYDKNGPQVLNGINLEIPRGMRIGLVGSTGSGKSTLMDILMALLEPCNGRLVVDGEPILGNRIRAWQQAIAHVPQSIFLADATIAENIALGIPLADIDQERVRDAARHAHIAEFIEKDPEGYNAMVGERGVRLSGGQRQRVGIARALYRRARVLVLDEATSALDNTTEQSVINAINGLEQDLTVLLIAHRLTTVRYCDKIVELENGRVVATGTYEELIETSDSFRDMACATETK